MMKPAAEPVAEQPLSQQAYQAVLAMLVGGSLQPNELVTERQIAEQLGMSRTPLREAVRRLEGERLLERQRSGALVVRPLPVDEYMQILAVRRLLEGESVRLAAARAPRAELEALRTRIRKVARLPASEPTPEFAASDHDLHLLIAQASGNPVLQQMIEDLRRRTGMFRFGRLPGRRADVCAEHLAIIDALLAGDAKAAQTAMQAHIDQVRGVMLERLAGH
jgi:DNA-binding GntR family transcriptional regulator